MIILDTSALIRFFTNDDPVKAKKIKLLLEDKSKSFIIPDVVFPELEYVLKSSHYGASRLEILKAFRYLLSRKNINKTKEVKIAFNIYKNSLLDFADCVVIASSKNHDLVSFDKKMLKVAKELF